MAFAAADRFAGRASIDSPSSRTSAMTLLSSMMHPMRVQRCRISAILPSSMMDTKPSVAAQVQTQLLAGPAFHSTSCSKRALLFA